MAENVKVGEKSLPHNAEAERCVLAAMILDSSAVATSMEILDAECFYLPAHQKIFEVLCELYKEHSPIDLTSIADELNRQGHLELVGGPKYLRTLVRSVATSANAGYHAGIVKDKANLRALIQNCTQIADRAMVEADTPDLLIREAERIVYDLARERTNKGFQSAKHLIQGTIENIESNYERKSAVTGLDTGYRKLNEITSGFQPSDLIILAARPSVGKTAFALNLASNISLRQNIPVGIFSLEMSAEQIIRRMVCTEARVSLKAVQTGYYSKEKFRDLIEAANRLMAAPVYVDDTPGINITDLRSRARRLFNEMEGDQKLGLLIIDYIQLITVAASREGRQQEVSRISRELKSMARDLNIPVIALSQLSRAIERRDDPRPKLSDLRESGAIEQDADLVMFVHRNNRSKPDNKWSGNGKSDKAEPEGAETEEDDTKALVYVEKHRNGPTGQADLYFVKEYTFFQDMAHVSEEDAPF